MSYPNQRPPGTPGSTQRPGGPPMGNLGRPSPPMRMRANTMQLPSLPNPGRRQPMPKRGIQPMNGLQPPQLPQVPQPPQPPQIPGYGVGSGGGGPRVHCPGCGGPHQSVGSGGRLNTAQRNALPNSAFAGPNRSYPVEDAGHAKAALGLIGNAPAAARPNIRQRADAVLQRSAP